MTWNEWLKFTGCEIFGGYKLTYIKRWFYYTYTCLNRAPTYAEVLKDLSNQHQEDIIDIVRGLTPKKSDRWEVVKDPEIPIAVRVATVSEMSFKEAVICKDVLFEVARDTSLPDVIQIAALKKGTLDQDVYIKIAKDSSESVGVRVAALRVYRGYGLVHYKVLEGIFLDESYPLQVRTEALRSSYYNDSVPDVIDSRRESMKAFMGNPLLSVEERVWFFNTLIRLGSGESEEWIKGVALDVTQPELLRKRAISRVYSKNPILRNILLDPSQPEWLKVAILSYHYEELNDIFIKEGKGEIILDRDQPDSLRIQAILNFDYYSPTQAVLMCILVDPSESTAIRVATATLIFDRCCSIFPERCILSRLKGIVDDLQQSEELRLGVLKVILRLSDVHSRSLSSRVTDILMNDSYPESLRICSLFNTPDQMNLLTCLDQTSSSEIRKASLLRYVYSRSRLKHLRPYEEYCDHIDGNLVNPV